MPRRRRSSAVSHRCWAVQRAAFGLVVPSLLQDIGRGAGTPRHSGATFGPAFPRISPVGVDHCYFLTGVVSEHTTITEHAIL